MNPPSRLNFHHLQYFWAVAKDGNLTRTAARLRVSQSALSAQIRQLEDAIGDPLFRREGRRLVLTEAGEIALTYADDIFSLGTQLLTTLKRGRRRTETLRLGAVATLSRNFQESFVKPLLRSRITLRLSSGRFDELLEALARHELDMVLANRPAVRAPGRPWRSRLVARQEVSIVGRPRAAPFRFPEDLSSAPMILPGADSEVRAGFDALCEQLGVRVHVFAEVDDMATMRLLARDTDAIALVPSVVVRDELRRGTLVEHCVAPDLFESFYAVTIDRHYQHPLLRSLLARDPSSILAMDEPVE